MIAIGLPAMPCDLSQQALYCCTDALPAGLQCFTPDLTSVAVVPDASAPTNSVLRLQAVYYPTPITCVPGQAPFNSTTTSWTSGGITSKSKRIFQAPSSLAAGDKSSGGYGGDGPCPQDLYVVYEQDAPPMLTP